MVARLGTDVLIVGRERASDLKADAGDDTFPDLRRNYSCVRRGDGGVYAETC